MAERWAFLAPFGGFGEKRTRLTFFGLFSCIKYYSIQKDLPKPKHEVYLRGVRPVPPCVLTEGPCRGTDFGGCLATRQTELWLTWVCIPAYLCRADSNKTTLIATPGHHHNMKISPQKTVMGFSSISRLQHVLKAAPLRGPTTPPAHRRGPTRSWLSTIGPTTPP